MIFRREGNPPRNPKLPNMSQSDTEWALLDLMDHGETEIIDGRWIDRHGYRNRMRENVKRDREAKERVK